MLIDSNNFAEKPREFNAREMWLVPFSETVGCNQSPHSQGTLANFCDGDHRGLIG